MREPGVRPVVLIVNQDLGFVCWLSEVLAQAGYYPMPALNSREAVRIVGDLNLPIDVAIVDPGLPGVGEAMRTVTNQYPALRTIAVRDTAGAIEPKTIPARHSCSAGTSQQDWIKSVGRVLKISRTAA